MTNERILLSNPNDDRTLYMDDAEYWEWFYDEYEPYEEPHRKKSEDLGYAEGGEL